jgi:hypothetical protein
MKALFFTLLIFIGAIASANDAGCGLGNVIIQRNSKGLQLLAWTTNGVLFTQPLGITSGTSGCSSNGLVQNDKQIEYFVEVNHDDLSREMALGQGEKLSTLAQLHGCGTSEAQTAFAQMTQSSFDQIVPSADVAPSTLVQNLKGQLGQHEKVAALCQFASL